MTAFGRAVDLDGARADPWYALGETLARLGRTEPARDALRRALTLSLEPWFHARVYASLGRVHAHAGEWTAAARSLRKALDAAGPGEDDRGIALDYGRVLLKLGDREATEWLTRAARAADAGAAVVVEAAAATPDHERAEALLREGLERLPGDRALRAALARRLARVGRTDEAIALAEACVAEAPDDADARGALRDSYAAAARWNDALRVAADEAPPRRPATARRPRDARPRRRRPRRPRPPSQRSRSDPLSPSSDPLSPSGERVRVRGALRRGRRPSATPSPPSPPISAADADLLRLGRLAPTAAARDFLVRGPTPPPPAGQLAGLLTWTYDLFTTAPPLVGLAAAAGHAAEALDRPLLVAVMGEFNAGKSSFVNALAGADVAPDRRHADDRDRQRAPLRRRADGARRRPRRRHPPAPRRGGRALPDRVARRRGARDPDGRDLPARRGAPARRNRRHPRPQLDPARARARRRATSSRRRTPSSGCSRSGRPAKATEKAALEIAHGAGKRVLGVLNKVDRADASEIDAVVGHVAGSLGDLVETIVPFSATRAAAARAAGKPDPAMTALATALDERFFTQARALKRATAISALRRLLAAARAAAEAAAPAGQDFAAAGAALARLEQAVRAALDGERIALRARLDETYRRAALEVREFVRPRSWLFGEHRATAADEAFLGELLEDSVTGAARADARRAGGRRRRRSAAAADARAITAAVDQAIDRFAAYARGVIDGGAVPDFFRHQLPRLRLEVGAIRDALMRRAPDPEQALFAPLRRELDALFDAFGRALADAEIDATTRAALHAARLASPLAALAEVIDALEQNGSP